MFGQSNDGESRLSVSEHLRALPAAEAARLLGHHREGLAQRNVHRALHA
jgi:hypothetical protein